MRAIKWLIYITTMSSSLPLHEFGHPDTPTIILLHPGGALHSVWLPFIRTWSSKYHLLVPDLITQQTSLAALAVQITTLIESHCKEKVWLVGSSLGANVALLVAAGSPHLLAGLVLDSAQCGGKPPAGLPIIISFLRRVVYFVPKFLITSFLLTQFRNYSEADLRAIRAELEASRKTSFLEQIEIHFEYDITPFLKNIDVPTLIVAGQHDMLTKSGEPYKLQKGIKSSRLQIIPAAGHVTFLQQPVIFDQLIGEFLNQNAT